MTYYTFYYQTKTDTVRRLTVLTAKGVNHAMKMVEEARDDFAEIVCLLKEEPYENN